MSNRKRYVYKPVRAGSSYRRNKKSGKFFKVFFYLLLISAIVYGLYIGVKKLISMAYKTDKMIIKDIVVTGAKNITKAEIKELLPFNLGDNLLKVNLSETENKIKKLKPELKDIIISRRWQAINIKLLERTPEAFVVQNEQMMGIDFDNKVFPLRGSMSEMKVPEIVCKNDDERKCLLDFIKRFKTISGEFLDRISEIKINSIGDIIFTTNSKVDVVWGEETPEQQLLLLPKFTKFQKIYEDSMSKYKQIKRIDMTLYSSGRAFVKPTSWNFEQKEDKYV